MARVLSFTGLDRLAEKPITGLSKGMKQRLCLGRTMIHDPAVLVLDEPLESGSQRRDRLKTHAAHTRNQRRKQTREGRGLAAQVVRQHGIGHVDLKDAVVE
jgi:ABC-type molybdenum transport system ATPase subunit/photorepair protein PhrA